MTITAFREEVALSLLNFPQVDDNQQIEQANTKHTLEDVRASNRRRCCTCYLKISRKEGRTVAAKNAAQSRWKCIQCDKHYCVTCFTESHVCTK
nr:unnamed protein product [Callosobruchus analis]